MSGEFIFRRHAQLELVTRATPFAPGSVDETARTIDAVLVTENPVRIWDPYTMRVIDEILRVDGAQFEDRVVLLDTHNRYTTSDIRGSVRSIARGQNQLTGRLHFDGDGPSQISFDKARAGSLTDVSAGYAYGPGDYVDIEPGQTASVLGREHTAKSDAPLRITSRWTLREVSLVPIGADNAAKLRNLTQKESHAMNPKLRSYLISCGLRADASDAEAWQHLETLSGGQRSTAESLRASTDTAPPVVQEQQAARAAAPAVQTIPVAAPMTPAPAPAPMPNVEAIRAEGAQNERNRCTQIRALAVGLDPTAVTPEVIQRAIDSGYTREQASDMFMEALRAAGTTQAVTTNAPSVTLGADGLDTMRRDLTDALALRYGHQLEPARLQQIDHFRGIGIKDISRILVQRECREDPLDPDKLHKRAISTISVPQLLGDSANKVLIAAFREAPNTFRLWAGRRDVSNFRDYKDIKIGEFGKGVKVGNGGKIESAELSEAYETYSADTYGLTFKITRTMWMNDDLGAFMSAPQKLGRAIARGIDKDGWDLLVSNSGVGPTMTEDAKALFATNHAPANYVASATYVLGDTGLAYGRQLLRAMYRTAGDKKTKDYLNLDARWLIVPPELQDIADRLVGSRGVLLATPTAGAATVFPDANPFFNKFQVVCEGSLSAATNGTTAWYLACDARDEDHMAVVYLNGKTEPTVERADPPNDTLAIGWRAYLDYGVAAVGWRGIIRSKGAS